MTTKKVKPEAAPVAEEPTKTAAQIDAEIADTVASILDAATWTATPPKEGAKAIKYLHVPAGAIELLGTLAMLRGKAEAYTDAIVNKWKTTFKDAQTVANKSETKRRDILDEDAKRKAFNEKVTKLFTIVESEATQIKKGFASVKELMKETKKVKTLLKKAQERGDTELVVKLNAERDALDDQIEEVMKL